MIATLPRKRPPHGHAHIVFAAVNNKGHRIEARGTITEQHANQLLKAVNTPTLAESGLFGRDGLMFVGAFRYALGRMTYIVSDTVDWLIQCWPMIPANVQKIILRDLTEAISSDDAQRESGSDYKTLGHDCDRQQWLRLRDAITKESKP